MPKKKSNVQDGKKFQEGVDIRNAVLGEEYARKRAAEMTDFMKPLQQLAVEVAWGTIWSRPGLSRKTRSLLNIAMFTALNRGNELRTHVRGALNNGCTREEITEVLLQAAVYCGIPAGVDAFQIANEVMKEAGIANK
jgi:4-carboxymuconolactone decarboxylase